MKDTHKETHKNKQDEINKQTHRIEIQSKSYWHLPGVPNITRWFSG